MSHANLWRAVRRVIGPYGRLVRVENGVELGTPDVAYCIRWPVSASAVEGWLELKYHESWPVRSPRLVLEDLTVDQVLWHEAHARAGGRVSTLVRVGNDALFLDAALLRRVYERDPLIPLLRELSFPMTELKRWIFPRLTATSRG